MFIIVNAVMASLTLGKLVGHNISITIIEHRQSLFSYQQVRPEITIYTTNSKHTIILIKIIRQLPQNANTKETESTII